MKKFFTLFALLSVALSASAETYNLSIWYETTNLRGDMLPNVHMFIDNNTHTTWPGPKMTWVKDTGTTKVYKWEGSLDFMPTNFIYSYNTDQESASFVFVNGGYYLDGVYDHSEGKTGYTIYWDNSETSWWENVYLYTWHNAKNINSGWTRYKMEKIGTNLYKYHVSDEDFNNVIFNNGGESGSNQTVNIEGVQDGKVYIANGQIGHNDKYNVISFDASLTVTDGIDFSCNKNHEVAEASYTRSNINSEWGTLCLPFGFNVSEQQNVTFYSLSAVNPEARSINFNPINDGQVSPGQAVLFKLSSGSLSITANNGATVTSNPLSGESVGLYGTFVEDRKNNVYYISADQFYFGSNILIKPYRGFVANAQGPSEETGVGAPFRFTVDDTEDIQFVEQEDGTVKAYYDLQGRKLDGARKGLVIENGKIIMVK